MISCGHLQTYKIKIKALGPVYIGSGVELNKKEYAFIPNEEKVYILNSAKLIDLLEKINMLEEYENYILNSNMSFFDWCRSNGISENEIRSVSAYSLSAGNAIRDGYALNGLKLFIRDSKGMAYVPGSSIKGALRTAIAVAILYNKENSEIFNTLEYGCMKAEKTRSMLSKETSQIEAKLFRFLQLNSDKRDDAVNDIMRGIMISDSEPIESQNLVICKKDDCTVLGKIKPLNITRECLKPGTEVQAMLTIDTSILKHSPIDINFIKQALNIYTEKYEEFFAANFRKPEKAAVVKYDCERGIILGGGAGLASKTVIGALGKKEKSLKLVSEILNKQFKSHYHYKDIAIGASPHIIKYAEYNGNYYQYGRCEMIIE